MLKYLIHYEMQPSESNTYADIEAVYEFLRPSMELDRKTWSCMGSQWEVGQRCTWQLNCQGSEP